MQLPVESCMECDSQTSATTIPVKTSLASCTGDLLGFTRICDALFSINQSINQLTESVNQSIKQSINAYTERAQQAPAAKHVHAAALL